MFILVSKTTVNPSLTALDPYKNSANGASVSPKRERGVRYQNWYLTPLSLVVNVNLYSCPKTAINYSRWHYSRSLYKNSADGASVSLKGEGVRYMYQSRTFWGPKGTLVRPSTGTMYRYRYGTSAGTSARIHDWKYTSCCTSKSHQHDLRSQRGDPIDLWNN